MSRDKKKGYFTWHTKFVRLDGELIMMQFTRLTSSSCCKKLLLHHQPSLWRSHPRPCVVSSGGWRSHYTYANAGDFHGADDQHHHRQDWDHRGFTVGIGGPVGSGKTALVLALTKRLVEKVPCEFYQTNGFVLTEFCCRWH